MREHVVVLFVSRTWTHLQDTLVENKAKFKTVCCCVTSAAVRGRTSPEGELSTRYVVLCAFRSY